MEFRKAREEAFGENLISGAIVKASNTRGSSPEYAASKILDNDYDSYWATNDEELAPHIEIDLKKDRTFNRLLLQEYIPMGQRVSALSVKYWDKEAKGWKKLTDATTIGYKRILRFPATTAQKLKIEFNALASPVISSIGIYKSPELLSAPVISRDKAGIVTIGCEIPGSAIFYTTDGKEPDNTSKKYNRPFLLPDGGIIKVVAIADRTRKSEIITALYDVAPAKWTVINPPANNADNIIDGNPQTSVELAMNIPLTVDLRQSYKLKGFTYSPVEKVQAANIYKYDFYVSADGQEWIQVKRNALFNNIANNPVRQEVLFDSPEQARYIKIKPLESVGNKDNYTITEIGIITR
jgi:alpha-L-fucosidase